MAASGEGETRSLYVVQRHFRLVRRGYDPIEVDRHVHVVSEWFRQSRAGETARELEKQLQTRERTVAEREQQAQRLLESQRVEAEATLEGARLRANAEIETATKQHNDAQATLAQASEEAVADALLLPPKGMRRPGAAGGRIGAVQMCRIT